MYSIAASRGPPGFTQPLSNHADPDHALNDNESENNTNFPNSSMETNLIEENREIDDVAIDNCKNGGKPGETGNRCTHTSIPPSTMMTLAMELQVSNRGKASKMFRMGKAKARLSDDEDIEEVVAESKLADLWVVPGSASGENSRTTAVHLQPSLVNSDFVLEKSPNPDLHKSETNATSSSHSSSAKEEELSTLLEGITVKELVGSADNVLQYSDDDDEEEECDYDTKMKSNERPSNEGTLTSDIRSLTTITKKEGVRDGASKRHQALDVNATLSREQSNAEDSARSTAPTQSEEDSRASFVVVTNVKSDASTSYNEPHDADATEGHRTASTHVHSYVSNEFSASLAEQQDIDTKTSLDHASFVKSDETRVTDANPTFANHDWCKSFADKNQKLSSVADATIYESTQRESDKNVNEINFEETLRAIVDPCTKEASSTSADANNNAILIKKGDNEKFNQSEGNSDARTAVVAESESQSRAPDCDAQMKSKIEMTVCEKQDAVPNFTCDSNLSSCTPSSSLISVTSIESLSSDWSKTSRGNASPGDNCNSNLEIANPQGNIVPNDSVRRVEQQGSPLVSHQIRTSTRPESDGVETAAVSHPINRKDCIVFHGATDSLPRSISPNNNESERAISEDVGERQAAGESVRCKADLQLLAESGTKVALESVREVDASCCDSAKKPEQVSGSPPEEGTSHVVLPEESERSTFSSELLDKQSVCAVCEETMPLCCCFGRKKNFKKDRDFDRKKSLIVKNADSEDSIVKNLRASVKKQLQSGDQFNEAETKGLDCNQQSAEEQNDDIHAGESSHVTINPATCQKDNESEVIAGSIQPRKNSLPDRKCLKESGDYKEEEEVHPSSVEVATEKDVTQESESCSTSNVITANESNSVVDSTGTAATLSSSTEVARSVQVVDKSPKVEVVNGSKISLRRSVSTTAQKRGHRVSREQDNSVPYQGSTDKVVKSESYISMPVSEEVLSPSEAQVHSQAIADDVDLSANSCVSGEVAEENLTKMKSHSSDSRAADTRQEARSSLDENEQILQTSKTPSTASSGFNEKNQNQVQPKEKIHEPSANPKKLPIVVKTTDSSGKFITNKAAKNGRTNQHSEEEELTRVISKISSQTSRPVLTSQSKPEVDDETSKQRYSSKTYVNIQSVRNRGESSSFSPRRVQRSSTFQENRRLAENDSSKGSWLNNRRLGRQTSSTVLPNVVEGRVKLRQQLFDKEKRDSETSPSSRPIRRNTVRVTTSSSSNVGASSEISNIREKFLRQSSPQTEKKSPQRPISGLSSSSVKWTGRRDLPILRNSAMVRVTNEKSPKNPDEESSCGVIEAPTMKVKEIRAKYKVRDHLDYGKPKSQSDPSKSAPRKQSAEFVDTQCSESGSGDIPNDVNDPDCKVAQEVMGLFQGALDFEKELALFEQESASVFTSSSKESLKRNGHVTSSTASSQQQRESKEGTGRAKTAPWSTVQSEKDLDFKKNDIKTSVERIKSESEAVASFDESLDQFYNVLNDLST